MERLRRFLFILMLLAVPLMRPAWGLSVEELKEDRNLTPERLLNYFHDFTFELNERVQPPATFLERKIGDCDDFATLAAELLKERGYTPKLVVVFMPRFIHVVCYVPETSALLDFNRRSEAEAALRSSGELSQIAQTVAESFDSAWICVSEFTFREGVRRFVFTDFPVAHAQ